jgi:hypothetical protein
MIGANRRYLTVPELTTFMMPLFLFLLPLIYIQDEAVISISLSHISAAADMGGSVLPLYAINTIDIRQHVFRAILAIHPQYSTSSTD